jgi:DNA polymerase-1
MARFVFDIETNGLLPDLNKLHSLVIAKIDTGSILSCTNNDETRPSIEHGLSVLQGAELIAGHNSIEFDIPAIQKVYPGWTHKGIHRDTRVLSHLVHSDLKKEDGQAMAAGWIKKEEFKTWNAKSRKYQSAYGSHSLAAWGLRLKELKGEYTGDFKDWSPEMQDYCEQDVRVTLKLWHHLKPDEYSPRAIELEHRVAALCARMRRDGVPFDTEAAQELHALLAERKDAIERSLDGLFPDWEVVARKFTPKADNKRYGYKKGVEVTVMKTVKFNPGSRDHIAKCFIDKYDWKPTEFTEKGKPVIDDEVLSKLDFDEAKPLAEYFVLDKRLGALAEGDKAWLKHERNGVIHAGYNHNGTPHGRMAHYDPNISQVPAVGKKYGEQCRRLFCNVPEGWLLGGADMKGMQDRMLAHFLSKFDGGRYAQIVSTTDAHEVNRELFGMFIRKNAKRVLYARIFGGSNPKLAEILDEDLRDAKQPPAKGKAFVRGERIRKIINAKIVGFETLSKVVEQAASKGYLNGLDGRRVPIRGKHAAMNYLLANADAVCCKDWMVSSIEELERQGLKWGSPVTWDGDFVPLVLNHDEIQIAFKEQWRELVENTFTKMAPAIGEKYGIKCPLAADFKVGRNWAETH